MAIKARIAAVALVCILALSTSVSAARPGDKPPVVTSGPSVAMESGTGEFNLELVNEDPWIYRGNTKFGPYDELRHVSLTAFAYDAGNWFVTPSVNVSGYFDGGIKVLLSPIESQQILTMEFDAKEWEIGGYFAPNIGGPYPIDDYPVGVMYQYTLTYPSVIE